MEQIVYLNGALIPRSQARISPFDLGFLYGYALFETMRAYSGHIFRLNKHLERLKQSAALVGLPLDVFDLEKACYNTLKSNKLDDARIRLTISIGEGKAIPDPPKQPKPTVLVMASGYSPPSAETYRNGYKAIVSSVRQNSQSPLSRLKTANYLNNILARKEAKAKGADEALLLNERNLLCEGSTSNVFLVSRESLITPSVESGCLPGITRQEVQLDELLRANEAFLTNSLIELMPLTRVKDKLIGEGKMGKVTEKLMSAYKKLVAKEIT
jgi:branched-subunit amino acid aminotransferase/4-amino-4-deoxychorismate lyase